LIIAHKHRYIFLRCRKTASTSVAIALAHHLGPDDLMLGCWREAAAEGIRPNRRFWRDVASPLAVVQMLRYIGGSGRLPDIAALNKAQKRKYATRLGPMPDHTSAAQLQAFAPREWDGYFKFCFVRNPYAQAVSAWRHTMRGRKEPYSFATYLQLIAEGADDKRVPPRPLNWPLYTIDDCIAVDFVGRYERLQEDVTAIFDRIGLPPPERLATAKQYETTDYRDHYSAAEKRLVERLYGRELDQFSYTF
jgi:hypothetical protein